MQRKILWLSLAALLAVALPGAAGANDSAWSQKLWHDLMSPYCPGRTLADCPSPQADKLRMWIQDQERQGVPQEQVEQVLYDRFGDVILQAPRAQGIGIAAYVIPVVAFLIGGALVVWFLRRQTADAAAAAAAEAAAPEVPSPSADSELERLVDEELGRSGS